MSLEEGSAYRRKKRTRFIDLKRELGLSSREKDSAYHIVRSGLCLLSLEVDPAYGRKKRIRLTSLRRGLGLSLLKKDLAYCR